MSLRTIRIIRHRYNIVEGYIQIGINIFEKLSGFFLTAGAYGFL
jgi:hypothetical protein